MERATLEISCHCGQVKQNVELAVTNCVPARITLCHCWTCRHTTGLLCASYQPVASPFSLKGMTIYDTGRSVLYFCSTCGCHIFRSTASNSKGQQTLQCWQVATGVVINEPGQMASFSNHDNIADTGDGGLSNWMADIPTSPPVCSTSHHHDGHSGPAGRGQQRDGLETMPDILQAACACGKVKFHATRPDESSRTPRSNFPDLTNLYHTKNFEITNPDDAKWWLRADGTKYLAGTCACESCRLTSGFEIQTWAFIPRSNIHGLGQDGILDFDAAHSAGLLQAYGSSPGVLREFCPECGATVFWHDRWRSELIDVSVGLLRSSEGALAKDWLEWWTERVSFAEDAGVNRHGNAADRAVFLVRSLQSGMNNGGCISTPGW